MSTEKEIIKEGGRPIDPDLGVEEGGVTVMSGGGG